MVFSARHPHRARLASPGPERATGVRAGLQRQGRPRVGPRRRHRAQPYGSAPQLREFMRTW